MPSLATLIAFGSVEGWPQETKLYQPQEDHQLVLEDYAACLGVRCYLRMCDLPVSVECRHNAEFMSPSGKVPFLLSGKLVVSEFEPIVSYVSTKGVALNGHLVASERAEAKAYIALVDQVFTYAERYMSWMDPRAFNEVSKPLYGKSYRWPLCVILPRLKQRNVCRALKCAGWADLTADEVCERVAQCCEALSAKLGRQTYFFGDSPTEVDAYVYGHLSAVVRFPAFDGVSNRLSRIVQKSVNLTDFIARIENTYFGQASDPVTPSQ